MATVQDKMEALAYWVAGTILTITMGTIIILTLIPSSLSRECFTVMEFSLLTIRS